MSAVIAAFCSSREAGSRGDHAPVLDDDVDAAFLEGRRIDAFDPSRRWRCRERAAAPALICDCELAVARDADRHLAAEDGGQRLAAAGEGDVVDLGRIDADRLGDQAGRDVVGAAGRAAGPGDRSPDRPSAWRPGRPSS